MRPRSFLAVVLLALPASAQQFVRNTADIPASTGDTEQVDFADVDLDGDWDAAFANGGNIGPQQNVLWINQGGVQGGPIGTFTNETVTRFPAVLDTSRDIEFADYDGDGDPDAFIANTSEALNQTSRFWTNMGGAQGGALGTYVDETAARWVGLGASGSSIPPGLLIGGGFIDFANDADFADFDDDGDLDFIQATWGPNGSGTVPSRLFSNSGAGFFGEFNPSGFQLTGANISNGNPGLWCEGFQSANTTNATGANCDIATSALDADWGDVDGDLDIDLLLGARQELPRLFRNRQEENGGVPGFRDVTGSSFQAGYATGNGHYEECFADLDGDDDLDLFGVNWSNVGPNFNEVALRNSGAGFFDQLFTIPGSQSDDNSAEPIDYDADGDLDVVVSNFSGQERIAGNSGPWTFVNATGVLPTDSTITLDSDVADVDDDGDYDVFDANGSLQPEWYLENTSTANDVTAPRITHLEQAPTRDPGPDPTVIRCQVYDNAPPQLSQWLHPVLEVRIDGGTSTPYAMKSSFAQVFRGTIAGAAVGVIEYRVTIADEHGNASATPWLTYLAGVTGAPFCSGDGSGTQCPCGNNSSSGRGCGNSLGAGARLTGSGTASVFGDTFALSVFPVPNSSVLFFQGTGQVNGGAGSVFGDGLRCAGGQVQRLGTKTAAANFAQYPEILDVPVALKGMVPAQGGTRTYQAWYRNAANYCTPSTFNLSNGWEVAWLP